MKTNHKIIAALAGAILLVALGVMASFWAFGQIESAAAARQHTNRITNLADDLLSSVVDAETGQRGYALTGDEVFLKPYLAVRDRIDGQLETLRQLTKIDAARQRLDAVAPLMVAKMAQLARLVELRRDQDMPAVIAAISSGEGRRLMDSIRDEFKRYAQIEGVAVARREAQFLSDMRRLFSVIVIVSVLALLSALVFAYLIYRETQSRLRERLHLETRNLLGLQTELSRKLQEANTTLREGEELFSTAFRLSPDCVVIVRLADRTIIQANEAVCRLWGRTPDEVVGRSSTAVSNWLDENERVEFMRRLQEKGEVLDYETTVHLDDGRLVQLIVSSRLVSVHGERCILTVMRDITERKRTEAAAAQLGAIVASSDDAIIGKDLQGVVTSWNRGAEKNFGYTAREMEGQPITRLIPVDRRDEEGTILGRIRRGESVQHFETVRLHKDGRAIDMSVTVSPIKDASGRVVGASKVARDITDRKLADAQIHRLNDELEQRVADRTAALEAANKELEAFSYSVSHDLRTPVRAIDGFSQAALEDFGPQLPEEGRRFLQTIRHSAQQMGALIDDLLAFSRLNQQELSKRALDTNLLVHGVMAELGSPWPERQVTVRVGDLPASSGDPALLKQVWLNLLSNALKYTRKRPQTEIEIGCLPFNGATAFFVRDNGTGFDLRFAGKLFGVFQRLHRAEDYEGTGVGLAIVQRIIQRHGGRVWAAAAPDRGATFYFTLEKETNP